MGQLSRVLAVLCFALLLGTPSRADEGWTIASFASDIAIQQDGSFALSERIDVDFGPLQRHGIFRTIPYRYRYDDQHDRVYDLSVLGVGGGSGAAVPYEQSRDRGNVVLKIGDANRTVSGKQTYVIRYAIRNALNPFTDHDELYWNVNGTDWPVPAQQVSATVSLPAGGIRRVVCYEGPLGSTAPCHSSSTQQAATFQSTRTLGSGENLSVVVDIEKGVVVTPKLDLQAPQRSVNSLPTMFSTSPTMLAATVFVFLAGLVFIAMNWYQRGRDHVYLTNYYLSNDPREEVRPLFRGQTIAPEYEPPEKLHPAEAGLLLDESADPKDVTATIVDLAARGYLTISELPKHFLTKQDWSLAKRKKDTGNLAAYERLILTGLFKSGNEVKLSELKGKFYTTLQDAQTALYDDSVKQSWFVGNPRRTRQGWAILGVAVAIVGALLTFGLGLGLGAGLIGIAIMLIGFLLVPFSRAMAARSAKGSDLLQRFLGFRMYMLTAEKDRQKFAEKEGIFSAYLPYAIVFGIVDRWANAFRGLDARAAGIAAWYVGTTPFNAASFSSDLQSFSSSLSLSVASTPGGSGSSGFGGGGFSGGGGGGGGGGSW